MENVSYMSFCYILTIENEPKCTYTLNLKTLLIPLHPKFDYYIKGRWVKYTTHTKLFKGAVVSLINYFIIALSKWCRNRELCTKYMGNQKSLNSFVELWIISLEIQIYKINKLTRMSECSLFCFKHLLNYFVYRN